MKGPFINLAFCELSPYHFYPFKSLCLLSTNKSSFIVNCGDHSNENEFVLIFSTIVNFNSLSIHFKQGADFLYLEAIWHFSEVCLLGPFVDFQNFTLLLNLLIFWQKSKNCTKLLHKQNSRVFEKLLNFSFIFFRSFCTIILL